MPPSSDSAIGLRWRSMATAARRWPGRIASSRGAAGSRPGGSGPLGLEPGDRILTWSPATPQLPAAYYGAMRAGLVLVPLDLRMAPDAIERIAARADAKRLDPRRGPGCARSARSGARLSSRQRPSTRSPRTPTTTFPADWEQQLAAWPRPAETDVVELIFTSGTTGTPKGVILAHDNIARLGPGDASRRPADRAPSRVAAAAVAPARAGCRPVLRARRRRRRPVRPEPQPAGHLRGDPPPPDHVDGRRSPDPRALLGAIEREVEKSGPGDVVRSAAADRPPPAVRAPPTPVPAGPRQARRRDPAVRQFGRVPARRRSSRPGRTSGSSSSRATARPRPASGRARRARITGSGRSGGRCRRSRCGSPTTARSSSAARPCSRATGTTRRRRPPPSPTTAGTGRGDIGRLDDAGRLILMGRTKDIIVLPNGMNVYPEDIENALRIAGVRDSVVVETRPGRIEAVVLAPRDADREAADVRESDPGGGQGRERDPRGSPASGRVPRLARGRLPAHPHPQGQARRRPPLGRDGRTAAGSRGAG